MAEHLSRLSLPAGIVFLRLDPYEDWTGEASFRAYFSGPAADWPSAGEIEDRLLVRQMVADLRFKLRLERFIYVEFLAERQTR